MSIVSSPGTEKTYSQPSAARQSTRRWAAVRRWVAVIGGKPSRHSPADPFAGRASPGQAGLEVVDGGLVSLAGLVGEAEQLRSIRAVVAGSVESLLDEQPLLHQGLDAGELRRRGEPSSCFGEDLPGL